MFLQLPILTIYAKKKSAYSLPSVIFEDTTISVQVSLKSAVRFSQYKEGGTFQFNPKEEHTGNYTITLKVIDKQTKKESKPVTLKVIVESYSNSTDAPRCPKTMNSTECFPWISSISNEGLVEIKFPYKLR